MNAEEIYRKYILKPEPEPKPVNLRRTGRTTQALVSLPPGSIYVVPTACIWQSTTRMAHNLGIHELHIMSLHNYCNNHFYHGKRALNGEMVAFDHSIYELEFDKLQFDKVLDVTFRYHLAEYDTSNIDTRLCKFAPEV
ncbi:hypothetical protein SCRM01_139c [Synechococcus phage S-CRM01]|uniref:hypothetical protein n=1 Tax=Synechococcus phage S-CRM01 TaxID=1026955 RepID=UPI000209E3DC|nr:hypothetical protein SCRM01_139c [Synechococcus phage S-CRM01]AEC53085.1 hypothetical protein SCRM01_139c [Synechococcus phage S-CRM01]